MNETKVKPVHLSRLAYLYIRQSSLRQVYENRESTARQYDLKRRARSLGWSSEQIVVIDEDLGLSGASASERDGFQRLVADVGLGRVGVVMGLEVSRLTRSSTDWHRLVEICSLADALILDEDGIYDPSHFNDRLLLGLKGTMSEAELHMLRARLVGGALNKARRGELWIRPPIGLVYDSSQKLAFDPDLQIQNSVRLLFETFRRTGSALGVVRYFAQEGLKWPRRITKGNAAGEVVWGGLEHSCVLNVLHNPRYAGAYVYGRYQQKKLAAGKQARCRRLPRQEWKVFIPNAHPGYISWEEFEANEVRLLENANAYGMDRRKGPPREGVALLQGIVICGVCGERMTVRYHVVQGHPIPSYTCLRRYIQTAQALCQVIPGRGIDEAVGRLVVEAVTPASLDVALQVFEELRLRKAEVDRLRRAELERARMEAEYAQHQYMLVRPENRLVADNLERQWNEKLVCLAKLEEEYTKPEGEDLSQEAKQRIQALASDLAPVWKNPCTPARDKKRMLRLLIEDVTLKRGEKIQISIRWKGGATTCLEQALPLSAPDLRRTPAEIVEQIRSLASEQTDTQIAQTLNHRGLRSGTGKPFTRLIVRHIRTAYGIDSFRQHLRRACWLTPPEMAAQLGVCSSTAKTYAAAGVLRALRVDSRGEILFEPISGPLPRAQPGKKLRERQNYPMLTPHRGNEVQYEA